MAAEELGGKLSLIVNETVTGAEGREPDLDRELGPGEFERHGPIEWFGRRMTNKREVDLAAMREQLDDVRQQVDVLLSELPEPGDGRFRLTDVEVGLSVTAEGSIGIATVGGEISLSLTYSRTL